MIRVVFDTHILFSAAFKRVGVPAQVLDLVVPGILTPCTSDEIPAEYLEVLACSDPDDNRFLECAAEAKAQYLVTGNVRHFPKESDLSFAIVTPRELLTRLLADEG